MELRTERLGLRPVAAGDLETLLAIRNAPEVIGTTNTGGPLPRERMVGQLERRLQSWTERGLGSWPRSARAAASTRTKSSSVSSCVRSTGARGSQPRPDWLSPDALASAS